MTKITAALLVVLAGCGADGGSGGGGDAGAAACRAPTGCEALITNTGRCGYSCGIGDAGNRLLACIPLLDGGAASQGEWDGGAGVPLSAILPDQPPYATDTQRDPRNCGGCGRRCAEREVCGYPPGGQAVASCYTPRI